MKAVKSDLFCYTSIYSRDAEAADFFGSATKKVELKPKQKMIQNKLYLQK